jgi:enterochelin esterase-like enzyme
VLATLLHPGPAASGTVTAFDEFLDAYRNAAPHERASLTRAFVAARAERGGFPIVEADGTVVFFHVGAGGERSVRLLGDFRPRSRSNVYWDERGVAMTRAARDGAVWFRRLRFETDARLDYVFKVDGAIRLDPLNPAVVKSGMAGEASVLVMPGHPRSRGADAGRAGDARPVPTPGGILRVVDEPWARPRIAIYLPAACDPATPCPVVYTADGSAMIEYLGLPGILDRLIADGVVEPIIAVLIDPAPDRGRWYDFNPDYLAYLERVVAYVDDAYPTRARAGDRLHLGTSAGGRAALHAGLTRPDLFGRLGILSPALAGRRREVRSAFRAAGGTGLNDLSVWLSAGTYEGSIHGETLRLERRFRAAGAAVRLSSTHEGHSFGAWRDQVEALLEHFYPARPRRDTPQ